jgi:hypothetical protein
MKVDSFNWKEREKFFEACFQRFGSMNKNDYEVALFHLLLKNGYEEKTDFELSFLLQIPESKVKRLRYEESLVFPTASNLSNPLYRDKLAEMLLNRKYRIHNERIQFAISDKHFRLYINDVLMKRGRFADSSFNSNIVSLTAADLLYLLETCEIKSAQNIQKIRKDIESGKKELEKSVIECFQDLSDEVLKEPLRKVMSDQLIDKLEKLAESITDYLKKRFNKNES